ncbi:hypothetical protein [Marinimicrobium sp. LS-A18]|uniref:hypothetical protein n=1 Tax=Marinimicrobium sp. LS-A18 TaxID=1381596 RepID=UPI0012681077|nr:hypothetical protein [Marinimicrobium sp. LS-A18]
MSDYSRIAILIVLTAVGCTMKGTPRIVENGCKYQITAENYKEIRANCSGFIKSEHAEEVMRLRNEDALRIAKSLPVSYEAVALGALLNNERERYCLKIFGTSPSSSLADSIREEDELLDCEERKIPRVTIDRIEKADNGGYRTYITFDCGLTGRCQSGWWLYLEEVSPGMFEVINEELDWIT